MRQSLNALLMLIQSLGYLSVMATTIHDCTDQHLLDLPLGLIEHKLRCCRHLPTLCPRPWCQLPRWAPKVPDLAWVLLPDASLVQDRTSDTPTQTFGSCIFFNDHVRFCPVELKSDISFTLPVSSDCKKQTVVII